MIRFIIGVVAVIVFLVSYANAIHDKQEYNEYAVDQQQ